MSYAVYLEVAEGNRLSFVERFLGWVKPLDGTQNCPWYWTGALKWNRFNPEEVRTLDLIEPGSVGVDFWNKLALDLVDTYLTVMSDPESEYRGPRPNRFEREEVI